MARCIGDKQREREKANVYYFKSVVIVNDKSIKIMEKHEESRQLFADIIHTHAIWFDTYLFFIQQQF